MTAKARRDRSINYLEFNVEDIARSKRFYGDVFGWTFTDYGPHYCEFNDGEMTGGFDQSAPVRSGGPLVVLYGEDLEAVQKEILAAGGEILLPVFDFPGGRRFHFADPDGYELAVWTATDDETETQP